MLVVGILERGYSNKMYWVIHSCDVVLAYTLFYKVVLRLVSVAKSL